MPPSFSDKILVPVTTTLGVSPNFKVLAHPGTTQVSTGDNIYVKSLLNAGWRWDTSPMTGDSSVIRWNVSAVWNKPLDATMIPPIKPEPAWNAALEAATKDAFAQWASVANIHPQFNATYADIQMHVVPFTSYKFGYGGYSGTPYEAARSTGVTPALYQNLTVAEGGRVHVYVSDHATGGTGLSVWSVDAAGKPSITNTGKEFLIHEIGHSLGLKHPHDYGASNSQSLFPGVSLGGEHEYGDNKLNSKLYTLMSYNEANPPVNLPAGGGIGGPAVTPMAFDIAAIQTLYGANTTTASGNDTYTLPEPGAANGASWQCIWDTGGVDQIVYNGTANAVIDLRPAMLDDSPTGGGMGSYTWTHTAHVGRGGTIAGDITNALPDQGGVTGVVVENASGGAGNDLITGNDADNAVHGGAGDDTIFVLGGIDIINGDTGNDIMDGGLGNDVFIFELNSGADKIFSFDSDPLGGQDLLDISELGATELSFATDVAIAQVGSDTQLHIGGSIINLVGINMATIDYSDFRFV
jgi:Ca2+-binding RTX toxin-like protein